MTGGGGPDHQDFFFAHEPWRSEPDPSMQERREASVSHLLNLCVPLALALLSMRVALEISTCAALYRVAPSVRSMRDFCAIHACSTARDLCEHAAARARSTLYSYACFSLDLRACAL